MSNQNNYRSPLDLDPELGPIANQLEETVGQITPRPAFQAALERRLASPASYQGESAMSSLKKFAPAVLWIVAAAIMILVIDWALRSLAPQPVPAARNTPAATLRAPVPPVNSSTPAPSGKSYDWNGTTLQLGTTLPDSPADAPVYIAQPDVHATVEEAMALAQRFAIQGSAYQMSGELPGTTDFVITDGRQSLSVRSAAYFSYTAEIGKSYGGYGAVQNPNAKVIISSFLQERGFTFGYRIEWSDFRSAYLVEPLSAAGTVLRYERYSPPMMVVTLAPDGTVASVLASLRQVQAQPAGSYGILSSEDAFQRLLEVARSDGMIGSMNSVPVQMRQWNRTYPIGQALTLYGTVSSMASVQPDGPAFIQFDGFPVSGQVAGLEKFTQATYVMATGQFISENGIDGFNIDSWSVPDVKEDDALVGTLQRDNDQVTLTTEDGTQYILPDVPADAPMPFLNAYVMGRATGKTFQWKSFDDRMTYPGGGGGGGGGGGIGFHKLNLTGAPVPFPTAPPTPNATGVTTTGAREYVVQAGDTLSGIASNYGTGVDALMQANAITDPQTLAVGQTLIIPASDARPVEALRGILNITITSQQDGSQVAEYGFITNAGGDPSGYMLLKGDGLRALQDLNRRPVDVWGKYDVNHENGMQTIQVDRFEIPFPHLNAMILHGTQKLTEISGQPATLFITQDGQTYVQLTMDGITATSLVGNEGDKVQIEALAIPGDTLDGHPAVRVFSGALEINPKTGEPLELPLAGTKPSINDMPAMGKPESPPTATVETIELVHFASDPRYVVTVGDPQPTYFQPAWRFYGHYSNGDEFEVLVQALRDQYLLPDIEPGLQPG